MCQIRQEVALFRRKLGGGMLVVGPSPPTPFPEGEGGDLDASAAEGEYAVGKAAATLVGNPYRYSIAINCSVYVAIVPFSLIF